MIDQVRAALATPHAMTTVVMWGLAGLALLLALVQAFRPGPQHSRWSRAVAVGFPLAVAFTLLLAPVVPRLRGSALELALFLRMAGFWAMVLTAPFAVGQVVGLRAPRWLQRTHLALGGGFLLLLATTDLVFAVGSRYDPGIQFGPLAVVFLVPVAAIAGWWLLACLGMVQTRSGQALFALGGSTTTLALVVAALVVDPVMADHFLVVAFVPVLAVTALLELQLAWSDRRLPSARRHRPRTPSEQ